MKPFELSQNGLQRTALDDPVILSGGYWEELRVFLAVAKLGSFQRAAHHLGLSTPTVNRQVRRLQDILGAQLVVTSRTGANLTSDGVTLARGLAELDHKVFSIANNFRTSRNDVEGVVRISVTEGLAGVFVASSLAGFNALWPGISVHLKTPINVSSLVENSVDVMIGFQESKDSGIRSMPLGYLHLIPIASVDYLERRGEPSRHNLAGHVFVDSQFYAAQTGLWEPWQTLTAQGRTVAHCDSSLSYGMAVIGGLGIGLLGNYTLSDPTLKVLDLNVHVRVPIYLLGLAERFDARPVKVVIEWLARIFGPANPWFAPELNLKQVPETPFVETMHALRGEPRTIVG